jgi:hypothetical protein
VPAAYIVARCCGEMNLDGIAVSRERMGRGQRRSKRRTFTWSIFSVIDVSRYVISVLIKIIGIIAVD